MATQALVTRGNYFRRMGLGRNHLSTCAYASCIVGKNRNHFMNRTLQHLILGADLLWITVCFGILRILGAHPGANPTFSSFVTEPLVLIALGIWSLIYLRKDLAGFNRGWDLSTICAQVVIGALYLLVSLSVADL